MKNLKQRRTLTMYRLRDHQLQVEKGRHRKEWTPKKMRICKHCSSGGTETELHFLLCCPLYQTEREAFLHQVTAADSSYERKTNAELMTLCLGEDPHFIHLAAQYVTLCHDIREKHQCWWSEPLLLTELYSTPLTSIVCEYFFVLTSNFITTLNLAVQLM